MESRENPRIVLLKFNYFLRVRPFFLVCHLIISLQFCLKSLFLVIDRQLLLSCSSLPTFLLLLLPTPCLSNRLCSYSPLFLMQSFHPSFSIFSHFPLLPSPFSLLPSPVLTVPFPFLSSLSPFPRAVVVKYYF